jgi:type I restriction enzyme R subunit
MTHEGSLALGAEVGEVRSFFGEGKGGQQELELETLSSIVHQLNDRFGLDLGDADQLLFDQFETDWKADSELSDQANSNTLDNFKLAFDRKFMATIVGRMDQNSAIFKKILDDDDFSEVLRDYYLKKVYADLRDEAGSRS